MKAIDVSTVVPGHPGPGNQKTKMKLCCEYQLLGTGWCVLSWEGQPAAPQCLRGGTWVRAIASHGDFNPNPSITEEE